MKKLFDKLEALKPQFIELLNTQLFVYTTIGSGTHESPMWTQMDQVKDGALRFINSQRTSIGFDIPVSKEVADYIKAYRDESYDFFKYVKYMHIKEVAPTVWNELAVGFNGARIHSFMDSYKPLYVKPTVEQLINDGVITGMEILEYAQKYMDGVDQYDDEQIDKYYQEDYFEQYNMEYEQAEHERMMMSEDMYGQQWESNDSNAPDYEDTQDVEWPTHVRSLDPEYIIASVSYKMEETYIFEANAEGEILDWGEYGGIAKRFGDLDWTNYYRAVDNTFDEDKYRFDKRIESGNSGVIHMLFKRL
jgi:hypothetical protein